LKKEPHSFVTSLNILHVAFTLKEFRAGFIVAGKAREIEMIAQMYYNVRPVVANGFPHPSKMIERYIRPALGIRYAKNF
jgi:hypothetical protein